MNNSWLTKQNYVGRARHTMQPAETKHTAIDSSMYRMVLPDTLRAVAPYSTLLIANRNPQSVQIRSKDWVMANNVNATLYRFEFSFGVLFEPIVAAATTAVPIPAEDVIAEST